MFLYIVSNLIYFLVRTLGIFLVGVLAWTLIVTAKAIFQGESMNTRRRERGRAASLLLCFLLSLGMLLVPAHIAQAQESTGTILGQLVDPQGGVLPGVTVTLTNVKTARVTSAVTDGGGNYRAIVEPGAYKVAFELSGFARQEMPEVNVFLGRTFTINAT